MGGVFEGVVLGVPVAGFDLGDFLADVDEGVHEAVQLAARLTLGGLDHDGAGHREAHGGGVEAVVHEALGDVHLGDAAGGLDGADVDDAFVCHAAVLASVEHRVVAFEALGDVVGVEDGHFGGGLEAAGAHHGDVHPADGQDAGRAPGGG